MNIIFGGSFNPPTLAHYKIVIKLKEIYEKSNIIIVPVGDVYNKPYLAKFEDRVNMLNLLFFKTERVLISDIENSNKYLGTLDLMNKLKKDYDNLAFVMGSDNLDNLDKWINYESLISTYKVIIIRRNNDNLTEKLLKYNKYINNFYVVDFNEEISSSDIRKNIYENKDKIKTEVFEYIMKNKLYGVDGNV